MASASAKSWNTAASLAFLALSLTYTGWSTYRSIVGQELAEDAAGAAASSSGDGSGGGGSMDPNLENMLTGEGGGSAAAAAARRAEEGAAGSASDGGDAAVPNLSAKDHQEASLVWVFHLLLALAGAYMAMAITNWGNADGVPVGSDGGSTTVGTESMWLKIVAQWLTMLLYLWSLWAPVCRGEADEY